jgi:hypothetical protein
MAEIIVNFNELVQVFSALRPKSFGFSNLFINGVHPGHSYAHIKLAEKCEKTIAIPLIYPSLAKKFTYKEILADYRNNTDYYCTDYLYFPKDLLKYEDSNKKQEIINFINGEYNEYLQKHRKLDDFLLNGSFTNLIFAANGSVNIMDMQRLGEHVGVTPTCIKGNRDFHADLQLYNRCGIDKLKTIPQGIKDYASTVKKQNRIMCYSWRDPHWFAPRRELDYLRSTKYPNYGSFDPCEFPKQISDMKEIWEIINENQLPNCNYYLLTMGVNEPLLFRDATVEDYNKKRCILAISSNGNRDVPVFPQDFIWINFNKRDCWVVNHNSPEGYDYIENYFSDDFDPFMDNAVKEAVKYDKSRNILLKLMKEYFIEMRKKNGTRKIIWITGYE